VTVALSRAADLALSSLINGVAICTHSPARAPAGPDGFEAADAPEEVAGAEDAAPPSKLEKSFSLSSVVALAK